MSGQAGEDGPACRSGGLSMQALVDLFPALSRETIADIYLGCDNNCEVALEQLLGMAADSPQGPPLGAPPAVLTTRQGQLAMLFPAEKTRAGQATPSESPAQRILPFSPADQLALNTEPSAGPSILALSPAPPTAALQEEEESMALEELCPWLVTFDRGQRQHEPEPLLKTGAHGLRPAKRPLRKDGSCTWWPRWPLALDGLRGHQKGEGSTLTTDAGVNHTTRSPPPLPTSQLLAGQHAEVDHRAAGSQCGTPPPQAVAGAHMRHGGTASTAAGTSAVADDLDAAADPPLATLLPGVCTSLHPGSQHHIAHLKPDEAPFPCLSDDERLSGLMPHLIHLGSPPLSGTSSLSLQPQEAVMAPRSSLHNPSASSASSALSMQAVAVAFPAETVDTVAAVGLPDGMAEQSEGVAASHDVEQDIELEAALAASQLPEAEQQLWQQQDGYTAADLILAVDFYCSMFPSLKQEVVGDVLQRYGDAPQTALDQLIMLSSCVADASSNAGTVPDAQAWEVCSSSGGNNDEFGDDGDVGSSWGQALSLAELAAIPADLLVPAQRQQLAQQQQQQHRPLSPDGKDVLPAEEKLALLKAEFVSVTSDGVFAALAACDGSLFAAAQLLRTFAEEDATNSQLNGGDATSATVTATSVPAPATGAPLHDLAGLAAGMPQHAAPKVQHLSKRFPGVPAEALEVALVGCCYDVAVARRTLREAGCTEADLEPSPSQSRRPQAGTAPEHTKLPPRVPAPLTLPHVSVPVPPPAPAGGLSLSEATYQRNQAIFVQERAQAQRLQHCYRRCFELAATAHARGDRGTANELRMRGHQYRQQYDEERRKASRRISKRVNTGAMPVISVDLHGKYVDEALETVESGIRSLPESIPGGAVVRYITGKGLHSAGGAARIKPEVLRLLSERGVPYEDRGGFVEVTLQPSA